MDKDCIDMARRPVVLAPIRARCKKRRVAGLVAIIVESVGGERESWRLVVSFCVGFRTDPCVGGRSRLLVSFLLHWRRSSCASMTRVTFAVPIPRRLGSRRRRFVFVLFLACAPTTHAVNDDVDEKR